MPDDIRQITVRDIEENVIGYITADDLCSDAWVSEKSNGDCTLSFAIPNKSEKFDFITDKHNQFVVDGKVFSIFMDGAIVPERTEDNKIKATVNAYELQYEELGMDYCTVSNSTAGVDHIDEHMVIIVSGGTRLSVRFDIGTAGHALEALLKHTGWKVKDCNVDGKFDLETEKKTILENIQEVQNLWGGLLIFDSLNRTVSLMDESKYEPYDGFQIHYGKNLKTISKTVSNDIVTRLYPYGLDGLNISSVNNGLEYIDNFENSPRIRKRIVENADIDDAEQLLEWGKRQSELLGRERVTYKTSIVNLSEFPEYQYEPCIVNHVAGVHDDEIVGGIIFRRIIYKKYNVFFPILCELEVGDSRLTFEDIQKASYKTYNKISGTINSSGSISGHYTKIEISEIITDSEERYTREITTIKENITNIENKKMYRCTVQSSDGEIFKNGIVSTVLTATVWSWDDDITSTIPATAFHWTRKSAYPERDEYWNEHNGVNENGNVRTITQDDVDDRAVFKCEIDLEE